MPGAPMVYYGDEVGLTGDTDPDDRRTYPWPDLGGTTNQHLLGWYQELAAHRSNIPALTQGDLHFLLVGSDEDGTIAYGRRAEQSSAIVAINRSAQTRTMTVPVAGFVPEGTTFRWILPTRVEPLPITSEGGAITVEVGPLSGVLLLADAADLKAPAAPGNLTLGGPRAAPVGLFWDEPAGAVSYNVYGSPLSGGGFVRLNDIALDRPNMYLDEFLAQYHYFVVTALDAAGNESGWSNEVIGAPTS